MRSALLGLLLFWVGCRAAPNPAIWTAPVGSVRIGDNWYAPVVSTPNEVHYLPSELAAPNEVIFTDENIIAPGPVVMVEPSPFLTWNSLYVDSKPHWTNLKLRANVRVPVVSHQTAVTFEEVIIKILKALPKR